MTTEELDLATWPIFHAMTQRGLLLDPERVRALAEDVQTQLATSQEAIDSLAGRPINVSSGDDVAKWMAAQGLGGKLTKGKTRISTDERALSAHAGNPVIDEIRNYRMLAKLDTAFVSVLTAVAKTPTHTLHPTWRLTKVKSGRVACENPNLMAFPKRTELGRKVRGCFVARPGHLMISVDYAQIEPRMVAHLSQDERLLAVFRESRDLYTETGEGLSLVRQASKVLTLGVLYGIGDRRLMEELRRVGCVLDEEGAGALIRAWFDLYPGVKALVAKTVARARAADGWVYTEGGRGRSLPALFLPGGAWPAAKLREEAERQAFNHLIQGTSQERMKEGMVRVHAAGLPFHPLLQMHDELIGEAPEEAADAVADAVAALLSSHGDGGVDFLTSKAVAGDWGGLK